MTNDFTKLSEVVCRTHQVTYKHSQDDWVAVYTVGHTGYQGDAASSHWQWTLTFKLPGNVTQAHAGDELSERACQDNILKLLRELTDARRPEIHVVEGDS